MSIGLAHLKTARVFWKVIHFLVAWSLSLELRLSASCLTNSSADSVLRIFLSVSAMRNLQASFSFCIMLLHTSYV